MELSITLTSLLPILRSITKIEAGPSGEIWIIHYTSRRSQLLHVTPESLVAFFRGLGIEILENKKEYLAIRLPVAQTLEEYITQKRDILLKANKPRLLTPDEIEDVLESIPRVISPVKEIGEFTREEIKSRVREQLQEIKITPLGIDDLKQSIRYLFERARVEAGETVGLAVAEALSALTQAALNAFHQTGSRSNVTAGIDLLQDLLSARVERIIEQCNVHFWNKDLSFEDIYKKRPDFVEITVGGRREGNKYTQGILLDYVIGRLEDFETYWWVTLYPQITGKKLPRTTTIVQLNLNKAVMYSYDITMENVVNAIESFNAPNIITVVPGPFDSGLVFVYPDEELVTAPLRKKDLPIGENAVEAFLNEIFLPTLGQIRIKGLTGIQNISQVLTTTWGIVEEEIKIHPDDIYYDLEDESEKDRVWNLILSNFLMIREGITLDKLETLLIKLGYTILGNDGISLTVVAPNDQRPSTYVNEQTSQAEREVERRRKERINIQKERRKARQEGKELPELPPIVNDDIVEIYQASKYRYVQTQGSNLSALFAHPDVDTHQTTSNNPHTMLRLIGMESARNVLISEFIYVLENSNLQLDPRHIGLLVDFMTNRGTLLSISFWGMVRSNPGPLTVSAFGKAVDVFKSAAAFGQEEKIKTTTASMFVGQRAQFGSGFVDLRLDEDKIRTFQEKLEKQEQEVEINPQALETAIEELDVITFGEEQEEPIINLTTLPTRPVKVKQTRVGQGKIPPPLEIIKTKPIISPLAKKIIQKEPVAEALPTTETVITVKEEESPTVVPPKTKRVIVKPGTKRLVRIPK